VVSDVIALPDGRRLRWHEFGDPEGSPVIYTAGTPVSGLGGASYDQAARRAGLRWISPDKPGYGGSDYHRRRTLLSWADDVAALADHLGLDRVALAGESGGGPCTLAAAYKLGDRVGVVALIASAGGVPTKAGRAGVQARIGFCVWLARHAPALNAVPFTVMRWSLAGPARRARSLRREMAATPEAKHADLRIEFEAVADALRQGTRGAVQELALIRHPWPFALSEVKTPVHLWHGARDTNVPIATARRLAGELPDAVLHVSDSADHDIGHERSDQITSVIACSVKIERTRRTGVAPRRAGASRGSDPGALPRQSIGRKPSS
jgi:pimeloyl-ACP methyl ester carboxylesterase